VTPVDRTACETWFRRISAQNRRQLTRARAAVLEPDRDGSSLRRLRIRLRRLVGSKPHEREHDWTVALNALGAEVAHRHHHRDEDLVALRALFDRTLDTEGQWATPVRTVAHCMKGYSLAYLLDLTGDQRYEQGLRNLGTFLLTTHPRALDGCLPYVPQSNELLVDTLGMVCPLLARLAGRLNLPDARTLAIRQLDTFVRENVDTETHLPYHGYYAGGPRHLSLHGWGRGTGWYLLGLADTLLEIEPGGESWVRLRGAFERAVGTLTRYQRADGHWQWAILHERADYDSSATAFIGYAVLRGVHGGLLDESNRPLIDSAIRALMKSTRPDGLVDHSSVDGRGLGRFPIGHGPRPWLQGSATAFAALYLGRSEGMT
jgi:rhamnogalacturonyl hydrolase YesR